MNILIVFLIHCYMATQSRSAPLPENSALVEDPQFQELVKRSSSLTQRILLVIPDAHRLCIDNPQTLQLNSSDNSNFEIMKSTIGIPPAPVLKVVSENSSVRDSLTQMFEGFQLYRALLSSVSEHLKVKCKVTELLMPELKDLTLQITKMLKMVDKEAVVEPSPTPVSLHLPGQYEIQVATHLTLVQLQAFGRDTIRCLRSLDHSNEED